jgi:flavin-dependent dehydrogenase
VIPASGGAHDVVVIGGGPAGSAAARLLASWGWSVLFIHHAAARPALAESLPASTRKLLSIVGDLDTVEQARFHPNAGNIACWAGAVRTTTSEGRGFHVRRDAFDRILRDAAAGAGAHLVGGVVRSVEVGRGVRVRYATTTSSSRTVVTVDARQVLDCAGRTGVVANRGFRRTDAPYRTLAIAAEWDVPAWPDEELTRTFVESYADGWAWSVPLSPTRRQCTVMIESGSRSGTASRAAAKGAALHEIYAAEIAKARLLAERLATSRATRVGEPWACDASVYDCVQAAAEGALLVGDAASFIEPLSSAGVKKALLSAWRAAVVTNTTLKHAAMAAPARDLYSQREHEVYADSLRQCGEFFAEAASAYRSPFWEARAEYARTADANRSAPDRANCSDEALAGDSGVRAAFDLLRRSEGIRLRLAETLRFAPVPAIEGREVILRDGVVLPGFADAVPFAAGIDLPALARLARGGRDVPSLIAAYHSQVGPVPVAGLLTGLSLLVARRALVAEGTPS